MLNIYLENLPVFFFKILWLYLSMEPISGVTEDADDEVEGHDSENKRKLFIFG